MLAGRSDSVMAGVAATKNLGVINGEHGGPGRAAMAVLADVCRVDVCGILASGVSAIVTTEAVT